MVRIAPEFTMKRQIDDYFEKYYIKLWERSKRFIDNNFEKAKELAAWKKTMVSEWDNIEVLNYQL
jgi:starch phosphorylase